jgi:hypothetical protein
VNFVRDGINKNRRQINERASLIDRRYNKFSARTSHVVGCEGLRASRNQQGCIMTLGTHAAMQQRWSGGLSVAHCDKGCGHRFDGVCQKKVGRGKASAWGGIFRDVHSIEMGIKGDAA